MILIKNLFQKFIWKRFCCLLRFPQYVKIGIYYIILSFPFLTTQREKFFKKHSMSDRTPIFGKPIFFLIGTIIDRVFFCVFFYVHSKLFKEALIVEVVINTDWHTKLEEVSYSIPVSREKKSQIKKNRLKVDAKVNVHELAMTLNRLERDVRGRLIKVDCRFGMSIYAFPANSLKQLGFRPVNGQFVLRREGLEILLSSSEYRGYYDWVIVLKSISLRPIHIGQLLTKIVTTVNQSVSIQAVV